MRILLLPVVCISLLAVSVTAEAATHWYVDGKSGNDSNAGTTSGAAFKNPWRALAAALPGDTVHIMPTIVYSAANGFDRTPINLNHGGAPGNYITIMGGDGSAQQRASIRGTDNFAVELDNGANYVMVTNLDVQAQNVTGKNSWYGLYTNAVNHVIIRNNIVHDSGGGGIGTNGADYVNIDSNRVYGNAFNTANYCGSGISLYHLTDSDTTVALKNQVKNNIVYLNTNADTAGGVCNHSDGNGIIIDDARHTQSDNKPYRSATFIYNNIVAGNGGRGIHIYNSDNVNIMHNSTFHNMSDSKNDCYNCGELDMDNAGGVKLYNNIAVSDGINRGDNYGTNRVISARKSGGVIADNNILWNDALNQNAAIYVANSTGAVTISPVNAGNFWGDPLYSHPVPNASAGNFRPMTGSKVYKSGSLKLTVPIDITNAKRSTTTPTIGAYE